MSECMGWYVLDLVVAATATLHNVDTPSVLPPREEHTDNSHARMNVGTLKSLNDFNFGLYNDLHVSASTFILFECLEKGVCVV
jgi:hypothetical protein